ncbi:MAG TPA: sulfite exporter TauE/SafE family protein [Polyangiaceae bacterium]|nr:sulfite exporter TauE/SafE family protein [Polyangiaceae bacterium]
MDLDAPFYAFALAGFAAQLVDGMLGMGYGVSLTSLLLALGVPPASASFSVHASEIFTSGVSGISHLSFKNVDHSLFKRLVIPGVIGGVAGAYVLSSVPGGVIKPLISAYLIVMGVVILVRAIMRTQTPDKGKRFAAPLALVGGFLDAIGGGGWGPVVTTNLVASGAHPRTTIGTVNLAEFFVTVAESITFVLTIGTLDLRIVGGLILGGVIAAPLGAWLCRHIPRRPWSIAVGLLIIGLSMRTLWKALN